MSMLLVSAVWAQKEIKPEQMIGIHPILGVQIDTKAQTDGLLVDAVMPGSIAHRMSLAPGDILLKVNGVAVKTVEDLHTLLCALKHGDPLVVAYRHGSQNMEKKDNLQDVPSLPSYEIVEGRGIPNVLMLGWSREQVEKSLGKPTGEQTLDNSVLLAYPYYGITIRMLTVQGNPALGLPTALRVVQFRTEFPFVGRTSHGLLTSAHRALIKQAYGNENIEVDADSATEWQDTLPQLGIRFLSVDGVIKMVYVMDPIRPPVQVAPASPAPTTEPGSVPP